MRRAVIHKTRDLATQQDLVRIKEELENGRSKLEDTLRQEIIDRLLDSFPYVMKSEG